MDFVTEMFYHHQESSGDMAPLLKGAEYRETEQHLTAMLEAVGDEALAAEIRQAALDFADVLALFFYRTGIKDGTSVFAGAGEGDTPSRSIFAAAENPQESPHFSPWRIRRRIQRTGNAPFTVCTVNGHPRRSCTR